MSDPLRFIQTAQYVEQREIHSCNEGERKQYYKYTLIHTRMVSQHIYRQVKIVLNAKEKRTVSRKELNTLLTTNSDLIR